MEKEVKKEWKEITNNYSERQRHFNGKYLLVSYLLDGEIDGGVEVQLYEVEEDGFDYQYEIFVNSEPFYGSTYPESNPYEFMEEMKKVIYEESFKKNRYSKKFINAFAKRFDLGVAADSFFSTGFFY